LLSSFNKLTIVAPATTASLAITDTKSVSFLKSLTFTGTDGITVTFPATNATMARTDAAQSFTGLQTFSTGITSTAASNSFGATVFSGAITGGQAATLGATSATTLSASGSLTLSKASGAADQLLITDTTAGAGITIGGDVNLYRTAANVLATDDNLRFGNTKGLQFGGTGVSIVGSTAANTITLTASSGVGVVGALSTSGQISTTTTNSPYLLAGSFTTNAAYQSVINTGGTYVAGVNNSAGSTFGTAAYNAFAGTNSAKDFALVYNGTEKLLVTTNGVTVTGALSATTGITGGNIYIGNTAGTFGYADNSAAMIVYNASNGTPNKIEWRTAGVANTMLLAADGGLVIGSPTGASKGAGSINAVTVLKNGTALDIVFEPDYQMATIDEMTAFYTENKHLPTIPTKEVFQEGSTDMGGLTDRLWETVEVQARYISELNDRLKALEGVQV